MRKQRSNGRHETFDDEQMGFFAILEGKKV
jgi:hypothetical protein